ncbi:MAG: tetratricopeptide repeat protein, partial [Candidatus Eisenbacteria bacterium]
MLLLQKSEGAGRIPLLLELAELRRSESSEGIRLTDEALRLLERYPSPVLEVSARTKRSYALQLRGEYPLALSEAERADHLARETKKPDAMASASFAVAFVQWRMASYAAAFANAQAARSLLVPSGPSPLLVRTISLQGAIHHSQSELEPALRYYLASLRMADTLHDEVAMGRAHNNIGLVYWDRGHHNEAHAEFQRALAIHERLGPPENLANTLNNMGLILIEFDRAQEAIPYLQRTLAIDQKAGNLYGQAKTLSNLGGAYEGLEVWRRALELHQQALAIRERIDDKEGIVRSLGTVASVLLKLGEPRAAIPLCERSIALSAAIGARRDEADQLETLANAYSVLGDSGSALRAYRRYHQLEMAMNDSLSRAHIAELEAGYRARERELELAELRHEAESKRLELRRLMLGSALLLGCLVLVAVLLILRVRSQRQLVESEQRYRAVFHSSMVPT